MMLAGKGEAVMPKLRPGECTSQGLARRVLQGEECLRDLVALCPF